MIRYREFRAAVAVVAAIMVAGGYSAGIASEAGGAAEEAEGREAPPPCPECGSSEGVVPIIYGYPGEELVEAAERGEVKLGGCIVTGDDPGWYCKSCECSW
jgi:hypothetical protein